jgi:endonuclease/exonuclease/phosphatase family metal-dependent hydrolase
MVKVCLAVSLVGFVRVFGYFSEPLLSEAQIHAVVGEPTRLPRPSLPVSPKLVDAGLPDDGRELKVITWNIERGQDYDSVLAVLRELDADVLMLQEVDRACRRTNYRDVARDLAYALDMNWASAGEFQEIGEARDGRPAVTGQAILSRFPIADAVAVRFDAQDRWRWSINPVQPRRGGRMVLKARTAGLLVYNTHIESGGNDALGRRQMAEILADYARGPLTQEPVVIGGDFNNGPVHHAPMFLNLDAASFIDALGASSDREPTSFGQRHPIDWLFVKNVTALSGRVVHSFSASDHFPVIASLGSRWTAALR